jgi:hypothetical protein
LPDPEKQVEGDLRERAARERRRLEVLARLRQDAEAELGLVAESPATVKNGADGPPPVTLPTPATPPTDRPASP